MPGTTSNKNEEEKHLIVSNGIDSDAGTATDRIQVGNVLAEMEKALNDIVEANPRIAQENNGTTVRLDDLKTVLEISLAINLTLVLDEILQVVMLKAVELLSAERGFIMLLDRENNLQFKTAYNMRREEITEDSFKISHSIADEVARTGKSVYTSDALHDERYSKQQSIVDLNLRSIMCVPLKIKSQIIGIIYLDNSSQAKLFLKSDLYLFELFAQQVALAIYNAQLYSNLSRLKQYSEDIITQSPVGLMVIDTDYRLVTINDASLEIFQVNKTDLNLSDDMNERSRFFALIPEKGQDAWRRMIETVFAGGDFREDRYFHDTGYEEKVLSVKISPTHSLPGDRNGAIMVIEDITSKVVLEKYVILSEKLVAKGEMASSIGHELNNYLSIIMNNAELVQINIDRKQFDKVKHNCQQVIDHVNKMKRFTDGLMDFSKMETEVVSYDIKGLIENLIFSIKAQKRFKEIAIELSIPSDLPEIKIDVGQIQQVLLNLINNAADALKDRPEPQIKIVCEFDTTRDMMVVSVTDNGCGMSEEVRQKMFQLHFTTKPDGHGLGLANSHRIIVNHGGSVEVISKEGEGTTFKILLPRNQDKSE